MQDPQYLKSVVASESNYIKNWIETACLKCEKENAHAYLLHNGLSNFLIKEFSCKHLTFVDVSEKLLSMPNFSPNDLRFLLYPQFIETHSEVDFFFFTDVSDVKIVNFSDKNLLKFYENALSEVSPNLRGKKLHEIIFTQFETGINSEWSIARKGFESKHNNWFITMMRSVYPNFNIKIIEDKPVLNCGLIGGHRDIIKKFMITFSEEIIKINPTEEFFSNKDAPVKCVDMPVFNYLIRDEYENSFYAGFPVHNVFAANDENPFAWFHHK